MCTGVSWVRFLGRLCLLLGMLSLAQLLMIFWLFGVRLLRRVCFGLTLRLEGPPKLAVLPFLAEVFYEFVAKANWCAMVCHRPPQQHQVDDRWPSAAFTSVEGERTSFSEASRRVASSSSIRGPMDRLGTRSCNLTARNGVQFFADVNVTLHAALERSVVESADSCTAARTRVRGPWPLPCSVKRSKVTGLKN